MIEDSVNSYIDVIEHPRVLNWLQELAKKDKFLFHVLARDNSDYLKRYLGKPEKQRHPLWDCCWFYTYQGLSFKILSNHHGTVILCKTITTEEDFKQDFKIGIALIKFIEDLLRKIGGEY